MCADTETPSKVGMVRSETPQHKLVAIYLQGDERRDWDRDRSGTEFCSRGREMGSVEK